MGRKAVLLGLFAAALASAAVTAVRVNERSDVLNGAPFGSAGPYERIIATVHFAIDPNLPANAIIRDIQFAPRNEQGLVEFTADLYVLKPRDPAHGNGTALMEISNRGGKSMLNRFQYAVGSTDPRTPEQFGDRLLMDRGFTLVWLGWQFDVPQKPDLMRVHAPIATDNGKPITGLIRSEFIPNERVRSFILSDRNHLAYPVLDPADSSIQLTVRSDRDAPRTTIPRGQWQFAREESGKPVADATHVYLGSGFEPGKVYEIVYRTKDPVVAGLGPAGVRDLISYLKYRTPAGGINVLGDQPRFIKHALGFGISQSGRFLRKFLYDGFNADEKGRKVFDGVWADVAGAGRVAVNNRFAQPSRDGHPFMNFFYPTDLFPFTDLDETDGSITDGLLKNAKQAPKIFYTNGSYEYWGRAASLIHTTPDGSSDAPLAPDTRIYYIAGTQHSPGSFPPERGTKKYTGNPVDQRPVYRALILRLYEWVKEGKEAPPSRYPSIARHELVRPPDLSFPPVSGITVPHHWHSAFRVDYGPEFATAGIISKEPPVVGEAFATLVPQVNADGNEEAGVDMPEIAVPLATYTGWNLRSSPIGAPDQVFSMAGSWFPFPKTKKDRTRRRDPRLSIAERYASRDEYLAKVEGAAKNLVSEGFLLDVDVKRLQEHSAKEWDLLMGAK